MGLHSISVRAKRVPLGLSVVPPITRRKISLLQINLHRLIFFCLRTGLLAKKDRLVSGKHQAVRERELPRIRGSFYPRNGRLLTRMDSFVRALCLAGTTIQTCISIDYIFSITLADSVSRTDCCTGTAGYALIRNYICHNYLPPCKCTCIGSL